MSSPAVRHARARAAASSARSARSETGTVRPRSRACGSTTTARSREPVQRPSGASSDVEPYDRAAGRAARSPARRARDRSGCARRAPHRRDRSSARPPPSTAAPRGAARASRERQPRDVRIDPQDACPGTRAGSRRCRASVSSQAARERRSSPATRAAEAVADRSRAGGARSPGTRARRRRRGRAVRARRHFTAAPDSRVRVRGYNRCRQRSHHMAFTLPELPYAKDALAPTISAETIDYHYGKHHQAYVNNLNKLVPGTKYETMSLDEIVKASARPGEREEDLQQLGAGLEPHVLLALPRAQGRRRPDRRDQGCDRQVVRQLRRLQEEVLARPRPASSARAGRGWSRTPMARSRSRPPRTPRRRSRPARRASSRSTSGSTRTTSTIATRARSTSRSSGSSSTGTSRTRISRSAARLA